MRRGFLPTFLAKPQFLPGRLLDSLITSGSNLDPVPDSCCVLRLSRPPKDYLEKGNILAIQMEDEFVLSTDDKNSTPPHLSVWIESLTTAEQAYNFLQERSPNSERKLVLRLQVNEIRKIVVPFAREDRDLTFLDVLWIHLFMGENIRDLRPGAEGHAGITGLDERSAPEGLTKQQAKNLRKSLRAQLAELASKDHWLLVLTSSDPT